MPLFHKVRRKQIRYSRIIAITIFAIMLLFSLAMSGILVNYISKIQYRREMVYINYNLPIMIRLANEDPPEELKPTINFTINCMLLEVKMVKDNMELYTLAVLFFYLNSFIMLFVLFRKNKRFLYIMSFFLIIAMYFTFTFCQQSIRDMPKRVLGNLYLSEDMLDRLE